MTSDSEEVVAVAHQTLPPEEDQDQQRTRTLSTASEISEDSASALLPEVTFGPSSIVPSIMGSPRNNRESQPLLGPSTGRHQDVDDFNQWTGLYISKKTRFR